MSENIKKLRIGIDINEVLRARCLQINRFYAEEFGEEGIPENWYVFDVFKNYKWSDTIEYTKDLKEDEDCPKDINPIYYQVDEKTGEAPADYLLFKPKEENKLTAKQIYNRFMYEDYVFEIHASAPIMYRGMDLDIKNFYEKYKNTVEFVIVSKENEFSTPSTLFFLSKMMCRFPKYILNGENMWDSIDILVTTDPDILDGVIPEDKNVIKLIRPYNEECNKGLISGVLQVNDLSGNDEFEKIINYIKQ
jgi:hypothetical protein